MKACDLCQTPIPHREYNQCFMALTWAGPAGDSCVAIDREEHVDLCVSCSQYAKQEWDKTMKRLKKRRK